MRPDRLMAQAEVVDGAGTLSHRPYHFPHLEAILMAWQVEEVMADRADLGIIRIMLSE
jgi:hypothetical protein